MGCCACAGVFFNINAAVSGVAPMEVDGGLDVPRPDERLGDQEAQVRSGGRGGGAGAPSLQMSRADVTAVGVAGWLLMQAHTGSMLMWHDY